MTKLFNRLSVRELIILLGVSVMGMVSVVGVMAQVGWSEEPGMELQVGFSYKTENASCLDNWTEWPLSNVKKIDHNWDISFIPFEYYGQSNLSRREQFIDFNGDGLMDYIYSNKTYGNTDGKAYSGDCVYINNGHGWDLVYRCYARERINSDELAEFYGDCADVENSTL